MLRKQILLLGNKKCLPWSQKHFCLPDTNFASETYVSQFSQPGKHNKKHCFRNNVSLFSQAFTFLFCRLRHKNATSRVQHAQHDYCILTRPSIVTCCRHCLNSLPRLFEDSIDSIYPLNSSSRFFEQLV